MKKIYLMLLFIFSLVLSNFAQGWEVYDAKLMPDVDPHAFVSSNTAGDPPIQDILVNPEDPNDSILLFLMPGADSRYMWRYNFPTNPQVNLTFVARVKGASDTLDRTMEFDFEHNGLRERLFIKNNNTWELKQMGVTGDMPASPLDWHIYRITRNDSIVSWYLDENPVPVATVKTNSPSSNNYFRWGDGNGSSTLGAYVDWVIWDESGAYAPGEGEAIPDSLVQTVPTWEVYDAKVLPDLDPHAFVPSNTAGDPPFQDIVENPLDPADSLLQFIMGGADSRYMWRYNFPTNPQTKVTMVARIKGTSDTLDRAMEFDFEHGGLRERLFIKTNNTWELKQMGVTGDLPVNATGWHMYRVTKEDSIVNWYLDENPVPVATVKTNSPSSNNYFRWGDGNGSSTLGAYVDWVIWDETGAYAPDRGTFIPDSLVTYVESADATLSDLTSDVGTLVPDFHPDSMLYELTVPAGTPSLTLTATANDPLASVEGDGLITTIPDTVTITVTAEDGFVKEYVVQIRESGTDASLSELSVDVGTLVPDFSPVVYEYDLRVPVTTTSITVTAVPNDPLAVVAGDGEFTDIPGTDTITVTAQEGNTQDYLIHVAIMSSDADLASLVPSVGELNPPFDPDVINYGLEVPFSTTSVDLTATANDPLAEVEGDGTISGLPATATITVTAEDETQKVYTVDITLAPNALTTFNTGLLNMHPNPASNTVFLELNSDVSTIQIYAFTGNLIREFGVRKSVVKMDVSEFNKGIYLIKVNSLDASSIHKLIIE